MTQLSDWLLFRLCEAWAQRALSDDQYRELLAHQLEYTARMAVAAFTAPELQRLVRDDQNSKYDALETVSLLLRLYDTVPQLRGKQRAKVEQEIQTAKTKLGEKVDALKETGSKVLSAVEALSPERTARTLGEVSAPAIEKASESLPAAPPTNSPTESARANVTSPM